MDLEQIRSLLKLVAESGVSEVEIEQEGLKLVIRKHAPTVMVQPPASFPMMSLPSYGPPPFVMPMASPPVATPVAPSPPPPSAAATEPSPPAPPPVQAANVVEVRAPIVGTFYRAASPDSPPYVQVGQKVKPGDLLCIIEAMKLMNEIPCEVAGIVKEVLIDNAKPVEYDQVLFLIETS
jgi:acetyl-CoA carboxylase biotin carboxyl carrier protein